MLLKDSLLHKLALECKTAGYEKIIVNSAAVAAFPKYWEDKKEVLPRIDGWPAIWKIADRLGFNASCGNSHQKQISGPVILSEISRYKEAAKYAKCIEPVAMSLDRYECFPSVDKPIGLIIDLSDIKVFDPTTLNVLFLEKEHGVCSL